MSILINVRKDSETLLSYLHSTLEGMIVARHIGHDLTLIRLLVSQQV